MKRKHQLYAVLLLLCAVLLSSCASAGGGPAESTVSPSAAAPEATETPDAEATPDRQDDSDLKVHPGRTYEVNESLLISPDQIMEVGFISGGKCVEGTVSGGESESYYGVDENGKHLFGEVGQSPVFVHYELIDFPADFPVIEYNDDFSYEVHIDHIQADLQFFRIDYGTYEYSTWQDPTGTTDMHIFRETDIQTAPAGTYVALLYVRIQRPAPPGIPLDSIDQYKCLTYDSSGVSGYMTLAKGYLALVVKK